MPGELFCQRGPIGELELCKIKTGSYRAAYQCVFAAFGGYGGEPATCLYHELKMFSFFDVGTQFVDGEGAGMSNLVNKEGISEIEMPEFVGGYAMKGGELPVGQQKIDTGRDIPGTLKKYGERSLSDGELGSIDFPEGSSFYVGCQLELLDPIGCIGSLHTIQINVR